jgi:hypothetical protein
MMKYSSKSFPTENTSSPILRRPFQTEAGFASRPVHFSLFAFICSESSYSRALGTNPKVVAAKAVELADNSQQHFYFWGPPILCFYLFTFSHFTFSCWSFRIRYNFVYITAKFPFKIAEVQKMHQNYDCAHHVQTFFVDTTVSSICKLDHTCKSLLNF